MHWTESLRSFTGAVWKTAERIGVHSVQPVNQELKEI